MPTSADRFNRAKRSRIINWRSREAHVESVLVMVSHEAPLFPREINCFERPHLEGLIFW